MEPGLPDGVFNVIQGDKKIVDLILTSKDISSVSFVGSTPVAKYIYEESAKNEARMEIALDSLDTQTMEIEANAEKLRAHELVEQLKLEMNPESAVPQQQLADNEAEQDALTREGSVDIESSEEESSNPSQENTSMKKSIGSKN